MNVAKLLHVDRLSAGLFRERAAGALQASLDAALAARPGFTRAEFFDCIRLALPAALDIGLAEVIASGWRTVGAAPEGMLIRSTHRSVVDVRAGERLLVCIDVRAEVTVALAPRKHSSPPEAIATDGEACVGAELYCAGALVLEEGIRPVAVPLRIALAPG